MTCWWNTSPRPQSKGRRCCSFTKGNPAHIHVASVIASRQGIDFVRGHFPADKTTVWAGAIDESLNEHSYIVPGLGDAGDLAYGEKD